MSLFPDSSATTLRALAAALRAGTVSIPPSSFAVQRHAPGLSDAAARVLRQLSEEGISPGHLALLLEQSADAIDARLHAAGDIEFVWTGLEGHHMHVRDTAVVVQDLFAEAERSVLISSFVVHKGEIVFGPLARRMEERPDLDVRLFLHVPRDPRDTRDDSELLREFAVRFRREWPWPRPPQVYYDPRSVSRDPAERASWHAKCVVVDDALTFVSSANFTEWAQQRNVEAGVLVRSAPFAVQVRKQFDALVASAQVRRVPGL